MILLLVPGSSTDSLFPMDKLSRVFGSNSTSASPFSGGADFHPTRNMSISQSANGQKQPSRLNVIDLKKKRYSK